MTQGRLPGLTDVQNARVAQWIPGAELVADLSWPAHLTTVLRLRTAAGDRVIKAANSVVEHHIGREISAGRELANAGPGLPRLRASSVEDGVLMLDYRPGELVEGSAAAGDPMVFRAAGGRLAQVHDSAPARLERSYADERLRRLRQLTESARDLLDGSQLAAVEQAVRAVVPMAEPLVRTHGDFQPRNWLVDAGSADGCGRVSLIDFGRYAERPWYCDVVRVFHAFPPGDPRLTAVLAGLGRTPPWEQAQSEQWWAENLFQGLSTVVWAMRVGDAGFAEDGRRMVRRALRRSDSGGCTDG